MIFVEFEAIDDADDGGRVELRGADGITPKPPSRALGGSSTGGLIVAFALDASTWPAGPMTLRSWPTMPLATGGGLDLNYTAAEDLPEVIVG